MADLMAVMRVEEMIGQTDKSAAETMAVTNIEQTQVGQMAVMNAEMMVGQKDENLTKTIAGSIAVMKVEQMIG